MTQQPCFWIYTQGQGNIYISKSYLLPEFTTALIRMGKICVVSIHNINTYIYIHVRIYTRLYLHMYNICIYTCVCLYMIYIIYKTL